MKKNEKITLGEIEFSPLQLNVLRLYARDFEYKDIAKRLNCSLSTVQKIMSHGHSLSALDLIGLSKRQEIITWLQEYDIKPNEVGLIELQTLYHSGVQARLEGRLELGLGLQNTVISLVDLFLKRRINPSLETEFRQIKLLALFERIQAIQDMAPPPVIVRTTALMDQALKQAMLLPNKEFLGAFYLLKGNLLYVDDLYAEALIYLLKAKELVTEIVHRLWAGRFSGLCYAYLGEKAEFLSLEPQVYELIYMGQELGLNSSLGALEGLGRSQGLLGLDRWYSTLYPDWDNLAKAVGLPKSAYLRQAQVIRSRLEIATKITPSQVISLVEDLVTGLRLIEEGGYGRYRPLLFPYSEFLLAK